MPTHFQSNATDGAEPNDEILAPRDAIETVRRAVASWEGVTTATRLLRKDGQHLITFFPTLAG